MRWVFVKNSAVHLQRLSSVQIVPGSPELCGPGSPDRDFPTVVDEFRLHVKVSPCRSLFAASHNVATSQPGHRVLECLRMTPDDPGSESWKDSPIKFSGPILSMFTPSKSPNFSPVWHGLVSRCLPFEHSSTKMGSLDIDTVCSALCPSIISTRSTSKFRFNTFQWSV